LNNCQLRLLHPIKLSFKTKKEAGHWRLTTVILATQEANQEDHGSKPAQVNSLQEPILKNSFTKKGLMEWLKVKALSSSPSTAKKKKKKKTPKKEIKILHISTN
jgi:hypothetical protein